jgi:hypothetical protein
MAKRSAPKINLGTGKMPRVDEKYEANAEAEVNNRVNTGYSAGEILNPSHHPTHFEQISPDLTRKSANEPDFRDASGDFKFSKGV